MTSNSEGSNSSTGSKGSAATTGSSGARRPPERAAAHVLLVHGSWHGTWVWEPLLEQLSVLGVPASAVSLPSCGVEPGTAIGLMDDVKAIEAAVARVSGPVLICAHSYGGVPTTAGTYGDQVRKLVYLCAFMPDTGMSLVAHFPSLPPYAQLTSDGLNVFVRSMAREVFYADCSPAVAEESGGRLVHQAAAAITTPVPSAAWRLVPSLYVVCTEDQAIPVEAQRMFAARAERSIDLATSHSPMLSVPAQLAQLLALEAATV